MNMMGMDPNMDMGSSGQEINTIGYPPPASDYLRRPPVPARHQYPVAAEGNARKLRSGNNQVNAGNNAGGGNNMAKAEPKKDPNSRSANDPKVDQIAQMKRDPELFFTDLPGEGEFRSGVIIASVDFLAKANEFKYAAELIKAALRSGLVAEAWAQEALAIALEGCNGSAEEIERARVSGVDLEPKNPQAYLKASKAMADMNDPDRALKFCRAAGSSRICDAATMPPRLPRMARRRWTRYLIGNNLLGRDW
jgi:hypothetical protein